MVTAAALPARDLALPAAPDLLSDARAPAAAPVVDAHLRRNPAVASGTLVYEGDHLLTGWHRHEFHQLEYAVHGVVEVTTAAGHHMLPPQQAAWIPAGLPHSATLHSRVRTVAVLFDPALVLAPGDRVRILPVSPVLREMVVHAARWPMDRDRSDPGTDAFFHALAYLLAEALDDEAPLSLPSSDDPLVAAACAYTRTHLASVTLPDLCRQVGVSERTLRRRFQAALRISWRSYLVQARVLRAMSLLAQPQCTVAEASRAVGFQDVGAFSRTFTRLCGQAPSTYRQRVRRGQD